MGLKKRLVLAWHVLVLPPAQLRSLFARELGAMTRFKRLHGSVMPRVTIKPPMPKGAAIPRAESVRPEETRVIVFEEQSLHRGED